MFFNYKSMLPKLYLIQNPTVLSKQGSMLRITWTHRLSCYRSHKYGNSTSIKFFHHDIFKCRRTAFLLFLKKFQDGARFLICNPKIQLCFCWVTLQLTEIYHLFCDIWGYIVAQNGTYYQYLLQSAFPVTSNLLYLGGRSLMWLLRYWFVKVSTFPPDEMCDLGRHLELNWIYFPHFFQILSTKQFWRVWLFKCLEIASPINDGCYLFCTAQRRWTCIHSLRT